MMKKTYLTIGSLILCVGYGVLSWNLVATHSQAPDPADSEYANFCSSITPSDSAVSGTEYTMCCIEYNEALGAITKDWQANLKQITGQERPASDMVEDAYESLRTYNCWMEYICSAVLYSGHAPIESALGTGLKKKHLGVVPGCQAPDNLRMESDYNHFVQNLKDIPVLGVPIEVGGDVADGVADTFEDFTTENKINFFPSCMTDSLHDNTNPDLNQARQNYDSCRRVMELYFNDTNCPEDVDQAYCTPFSSAFVTLDDELKRANADQKARALESKLGIIAGKMSTMEEHVNYMHNFLTQLDARFKCYISQCD